MQDENAAKGLFGFHVDNTIGGNPQPNGWMDNWVDFFRERRLGYQLSICSDGKLKQMGQKLMKNLDKFFEGVEVCFHRARCPEMSLLQGSFAKRSSSVALH